MIAPPPALIVLIRGVAGSGKTTLGARVAQALGWPYFEADAFHRAANLRKMSLGIPLDDADRVPSLAAIRDRMDGCVAEGRSAVFMCSALKQSYRDMLLRGSGEMLPIFPAAPPEIIRQRGADRAGHFMKADMVQSQFDILEPPQDVETLDASQSLEIVCAWIVARVQQATSRHRRT